jgi:hypothetical protein
VKLAIDPGSTAVGLSPWLRGNPLPLKTIYPKGDTFEERRENLRYKLTDYLLHLQAEHEDRITVLAIEAFQPKYLAKKVGGRRIDLTTSIRKLEFITGYTLGILQEMLKLNLEDIFLVSKKFKPKVEAQVLAKALGLKGSEDAMDALHIAILAGFSR